MKVQRIYGNNSEKIDLTRIWNIFLVEKINKKQSHNLNDQHVLKCSIVGFWEC